MNARPGRGVFWPLLLIALGLIFLLQNYGFISGISWLDATQLNLTLNGGATRSYHVSGGASQLVEAHSANPDLRLRVSGGSNGADVRLDQTSSGFFHPVGAGDVEIRLASDVPTSLTINLGAGEFDIDLSDVRVTDARVNIGASSMRFALPKPSGDVAIRMNGGASNIVLVVPDGVDARIATTGGLLSLRSDNTRLGSGLGSGLGGPSGGCVACGSSVETNGYNAAHDRVTLTISAGVSSIVVR